VRKEAYLGSDYTSARLLKGKFSFKYGKVELGQSCLLVNLASIMDAWG
jgi:hypothetical protein